MAAPGMPRTQLEVWSDGTSMPGQMFPVAAIAPNRLIATGFPGDGSTFTMELFAVSQTGVASISSSTPAHELSTWANSPLGVVAAVGYLGGDECLARVKLEGSDLTVTSGDPLPASVERLLVAGDGSEIVLSLFDDTIRGYDPDTLEERWSAAKPIGENESGYLAFAPRAGRWVWVNTSPLEVVHFISPDTVTPGTPSSGYYPTALTYDLSAISGATVISSELRALAGLDTGPGAGATLEVGGTLISSDLAAATEWTGYGSEVRGEVVAMSPASSLTYVLDTTDWSYEDASFIVTVDNAAAGGGNVELRDDTGAVLDAIPFADDDTGSLTWASLDGGSGVFVRGIYGGGGG